MFDAATGKLIGNTDLFNVSPCGGRFILSSEIIANLQGEDPPAQDVDGASFVWGGFLPRISLFFPHVIFPRSPPQTVMMVLDRSGSMTELDESGNTKMQELRESAKLFVELLREDASHAIGSVSFSSSASLDYELDLVSPSVKDDLIGPGEVIDNLTPSGATSIGDGLSTAQDQFDGASPNKPSILLMTDGLQNAPPTIENVMSELEGTSVCSVGFGTDANLNGWVSFLPAFFLEQ